jgi:ABC-type multidrug transport system fused ATPase/permease subunit
MNQTTSAAIAAAPPLESSTPSVLAAEGIEKSFRRGMWPFSRSHQVLRGVDLTLRPGEVVGLVGRTARVSQRL